MFLQENVTMVTDKKGRQLSVNRMDPADQLDFFEACSGGRASNPAWVSMALWTASCVAIDGVPVSPPTNPDQIKSLARRLGHDGLIAIRNALDSDEASSADGPSTDGVDIDLAKN